MQRAIDFKVNPGLTNVGSNTFDNKAIKKSFPLRTADSTIQ